MIETVDVYWCSGAFLNDSAILDKIKAEMKNNGNRKVGRGSLVVKNLMME